MKTVRLLIFVALSLLLSVAATAGHRITDVEKKQVKTIEVRNVNPKNGKNVALSLEVDSASTKLPNGLTALVNDRQVNVYDDGRWPDERASDGIYTVGATTRDHEPLKEKSTLRLQTSGFSLHHAPQPAVSCTLRVVECPKTCTSIIFGSKCAICLKLEECTIEF